MTAKITHNIESKSGLKPERISRTAMTQTHFLKSDLIIENY
jgi:hypothetical protein